MEPNTNNRRFTIPAAMVAALTAVALSGCIGSAEASMATIYVKDAAADDYQEIFVTYTSVLAQANGSEEWILAFEGEETIELLALADSAAKAKLADLDLAEGSYQGLQIAISQVVAVDHNDTAHELDVIGNALILEIDFDVVDGEVHGLLIDFDVEAALAGEPGTFEPTAKSVQSSQVDSDGDGLNDIEDTDDDNDGIEDADDDDINGDNKTDKPKQKSSNYFGLCTAWMASENGRSHRADFNNSTSFSRLKEAAANQSMEVEEFCDTQPFPGRSGDVPERAQEARAAAQERREARKEARQDGAGNQTERGQAPEDKGRPNGTGRPDEQSRPEDDS